MVYDPVKAHEYYIRTRQLKGDQPKGTASKSSPRSGSNVAKTVQKSSKTPVPPSNSSIVAAKERVVRIKGKVDKLQSALTETLNALSVKRQNKRKEDKKNTDGKSTEKEKQAAQDYRDKNQAKLAEKQKQDAKSGGGSSTRSVSSMSETELVDRASRIRSALSSARDQLAEAQQALGQLSHADMEASGVLLHYVTRRPTISRKDSVKMTATAVEPDFSGYATRNDLRCSDGRTILADAFKENDTHVVPLLWQHGHNDPENVLGHVKLENRADGVYARAFFNKSAKAQHMKDAVNNGDVKHLSIFANNLVERAKQVVKGNIREVSLVLAGANPGAKIDFVNFAHGVGEFEDFSEEAFITTGMDIEVNLAHADTATVEEDETVQDVMDTLNDKQAAAVEFLLAQALTVGSNGVQHDDMSESSNEEGAEESSETSANEEDETSEENADADADANAEGDSSDDTDEAEKDALADQVASEVVDSADPTNSTDVPVGAAEGDANDSDNADGVDNDTDTDAGDAVQHTNQEDNSMTHNVFDQAQSEGTTSGQQRTLSHDDIKAIVAGTVRTGSMKAAVEDFGLAHGIENIEYLFPDSKLIEASPNYLARRMEWVQKVLDGVRRTPFARIKTVTADITADEARAKGYVRGNFKEEEFFTLLKRETTPQTVYKKQKLDRDDVVDITDLDVVAWVKAEMKLMLDEELAAAILVGDGRSSAADDKIKEDKIRPIASDAELYVTTAYVNLGDGSSSIEELVDSIIANRQYWKGTGQPTLFVSENTIASFLNVKNGFGQRIYKNLSEVAEVLRVREIVPVEVLDRDEEVLAIMVNLADYSIGTDRGGQATMFDDFDLDYNKLIYLLETRLCGALTLPKSAVVFRGTASNSVLVAPVEPAFDPEANEVTVATTTGVVYKDADGTTLTTGSPVTITAEDSPYKVFATPASGYHFANNAEDEYTFYYQA